MRKVLNIMLTISLLTFIMTPTGAFAASNQDNPAELKPSVTIQVNENKLTIVSKTIAQANQYVSIKNNLYSVDPELEKVIGLEAYNIYVDGANKLNDELQTGLYHIDGNNQLIQNKTSTPSITPFMYGDTSWWGVSAYLSDSESRDLVTALSFGAFGAVVVVALAATIEAVSLGAATPVLVILGAAAGFYASEVSNRNTGNGVRLDYNWFYRTVTVHSR